MKPIVLIGANGQLGSDLRRELSELDRPVLNWTRSDVDVRDHQRVAELLDSTHPDVVINTTAFHKVEACEEDPEQAFAVNCLAVRNLAAASDRIGACLVHISTDYVFDGESSRPYTESAAPNPLNVYGASKAAGEYFVRNMKSHHLLIRTSGLYGLAGSSGKGGNFVQTMLRLGRERGEVSVVNDQVLSPTYTLDLARMIRRLIADGAEGLFHVTNSGGCSWHEFARAIFYAAGQHVETLPISTEATNSPVRRPRYSVLGNERLEASGYERMRAWGEALVSYLEAIGQSVVTRSSTGAMGVGHAAN